MVSSRAFKKFNLRAGSLIESVIAISIIAICLLVAIKLYAAILDAKTPTLANQVKFQVDRLVSEMRLNPNFNSEIYDFDTYKISKTVSENEEKLRKVSYFVEHSKDTVIYHYYFLVNEE